MTNAAESIDEHARGVDRGGDTDDQRVRDELARTLFLNAWLAVMASLLIAAFTIALLYPYVDHGHLLAWCISLGVMLAARIGLLVAYRRRSPRTGDGPPWAWGYTCLALVTGCVWGALPVLFLDMSEPLTFIGLPMILTGISSGTIALYSCWPPAYLAFTTPVLVTVSVAVMAFGGSYVLIGALGLVAYVVYSGLTLLSYFRLRQSVLMQFRNHELAARLGAEKVRSEDANRAKSQVLAAISHDLRQPLQSIRLYIDLLRQKSRGDEAGNVIDKVEHSVAALTDMFDQLVDMSRMDAHLIEVNMERVDLEQLAERVYSQFIALADHKGIELEIDCPELWGWADTRLLARVLDNLVSNALRYTEEGDVLVVFSRNGDTIDIDVVDSGPGIPPAERQRIFEEFYQLHNASRQRSEGLGIGLSIVRRLCDLMQVGVEIGSTEGGGTRVRLQLAAAEPVAATARSVRPACLPERLDGCRVMVVEDDAAVRDAICSALTGHGCRVSAHATAEHALAALDTEAPPAVLVSDICLPGDMDGDQLLDAIRMRTRSTIPCVLITSGSEEEWGRRGSNERTERLYKPIHADALLASVARWAGRD